VKAQGGDVRMLYSPLDAVRLAQNNPDRHVVFFAVGFETTAPANAMAVWQAQQFGLDNFSILSSHVLVPPAMIALLGALIPSLYPTYLSDLGFSLGEVAAIAAPATLLGTVIGASTTSWFLGRFGYKATILTAAFMIVAAVIPIAWMGSLENPTFAIVFAVTLNGIALPSFLDVSFQAARLKWASKSQAATDYTSQIVTMTAGGGLAVAVGGFMAEHLGWFYYFLTAGLLISVACFVLNHLFDTVEEIVDARDREEAGELDAAGEPAT